MIITSEFRELPEHAAKRVTNLHEDKTPPASPRSHVAGDAIWDDYFSNATFYTSSTRRNNQWKTPPTTPRSREEASDDSASKTSNRPPLNLPMRTYSEAVQQKHHIVAASPVEHWTEQPTHTLVKGGDGEIRRFPADHGPLTRYPDGLTLGKALERSLNHVYDARKVAIEKEVAGFIFDAKSTSLQFAVDGVPTEAAAWRGPASAFDLGEGKWMIPQTDMRGCTQACEAMLLAEGKTTGEVQQILNELETNQLAARRDNDELVESLARGFGRQPDLQEFTGPSKTVLTQLQQAVEERGSAILLGKGHVSILDGIENRNGVHYLTLRDPFHGSVVQIKDHEEFWERTNESPILASGDLRALPTDPTAERSLSVIFPPTKDSRPYEEPTIAP